MKTKRFSTIALGLLLALVLAVGAATAFATEENGEVAEAPMDEQEVTPGEEMDSDTADAGVADAPEAEQAVAPFASIEATAAEVLGVSEESLAELNHADDLYQTLVDAGKLEEFKTALFAAKQAQYAEKSDGEALSKSLREKLDEYEQVIENWDGATELVVSSSSSSKDKDKKK